MTTIDCISLQVENIYLPNRDLDNTIGSSSLSVDFVKIPGSSSVMAHTIDSSSLSVCGHNVGGTVVEMPDRLPPLGKIRR